MISVSRVGGTASAQPVKQRSCFSALAQKISNIWNKIVLWIKTLFGCHKPISELQAKKILECKTKVPEDPKDGSLAKDTEELSGALGTFLEHTFTSFTEDDKGRDAIHQHVDKFKEFISKNTDTTARYGGLVIGQTVAHMLVYSDEKELQDPLLQDWLKEVYYLTTSIDPNEELPSTWKDWFDAYAPAYNPLSPSSDAFDKLPKNLQEIIEKEASDTNKQKLIAQALVPKLDVKKLLSLMKNEKEAAKDLIKKFLATSIENKIKENSGDCSEAFSSILEKMVAPKEGEKDSAINKIVGLIIPKVTDRIAGMIQSSQWKSMVDDIVRQGFRHVDQLEQAESNNERNEDYIRTVKEKLHGENITNKDRERNIRLANSTGVWPYITEENYRDVVPPGDITDEERKMLNTAYLGNFLHGKPQSKRHFITDCFDPLIRRLISTDFLKSVLTDKEFKKSIQEMPFGEQLIVMIQDGHLDQFARVTHLFLYSTIRAEMEKKLSLEALEPLLNKETIGPLIGETVLANATEALKGTHFTTLLYQRKEDVVAILQGDGKRKEHLFTELKQKCSEYAHQYSWEPLSEQELRALYDAEFETLYNIQREAKVNGKDKRALSQMIDHYREPLPSGKNGVYGKFANRFIFDLGQYNRLLKPIAWIFEKSIGSTISSAAYPYRHSRHATVQILTNVLKESFGDKDKVKELYGLKESNKPKPKELNERTQDLAKVIYSLIMAQFDDKSLAGLKREGVKLFIGNEKDLDQLIYKIINKGFLKHTVPNAALINTISEVVAKHLNQGLTHADRRKNGA